VIGSANLTVAGLNNKIEAGMLLDFDLADAADKTLIDNIEEHFVASVTDHPENVVKVDNIPDLDNLLAAGRLVDELKIRHRDVAGPDDADSSDHDCEIDSGNDSDGVPLIKLKVKPLQSGIVRAKAVPKTLTGTKPPEMMPEAISQPIPASRVGLEPEETATLPVNYYRKIRRKRRRNEDGPRLKARRAKAEAIRRGKKWYRTGDPCIYGHYSDRLVSNGKCRECSRQDSQRANRLGLYR
jgi:hypothetical protein